MEPHVLCSESGRRRRTILSYGLAQSQFSAEEFAAGKRMEPGGNREGVTGTNRDRVAQCAKDHSYGQPHGFEGLDPRIGQLVERLRIEYKLQPSSAEGALKF